MKERTSPPIGIEKEAFALVLYRGVMQEHIRSRSLTNPSPNLL